jgi:hypothetical protein
MLLEDKVLRGIFGPKRDYISEGLLQLDNEELYHLYSSPNIIWMIE